MTKTQYTKQEKTKIIGDLTKYYNSLGQILTDALNDKVTAKNKFTYLGDIVEMRQIIWDHLKSPIKVDNLHNDLFSLDTAVREDIPAYIWKLAEKYED